MRSALPYRPVISVAHGSVTEPSREVPIWAEVDLCIVGGGAAGVGAAVGAARAGIRKILLIERYGFCGGANVAGLSNTLCGLFASATKKPEFITQGFSREFHDKLQARGGLADPFPFGKTFLCVHDPLVWKDLADDYLVENGIDVLYHTLFVDAVVHDGEVAHIIVENKDGRGAIASRTFVDASGDADLIARANAGYTQGVGGVTQAPTMMFRMMNVDVSLAIKTGPEQLEEKIREARKTGDYNLPRSHCYMYPSPRTGEYSCNMTRLAPPENAGRLCLSGVSTDDLTYSEMEGRKLVREYERFLQDHVPGFEKSVVNDVGTQIGIRQTRSIVGRGTLKNRDVLQARKCGAEAVTRSAWPIEDHTGGEVRIVYLDSDYYEIPAATLIPVGLNNVWVAGRCFSAEHEALASARVVAQCLEMGDSAGRMAHRHLVEVHKL